MTDFSEANPPVASPCNQCPWRRTSMPGFLGPLTAEQWIELAQSDSAIACHKTIKRDGDWEGVKQCAGAASFRANICKSPRDPRVAKGPCRDDVFGHPSEFIAYHQGEV